MVDAKRGRGRPVTKEYPDRIDASPEQIAEAMFKMPADHKWKYPERERRKQQRQSNK